MKITAFVSPPRAGALAAAYPTPRQVHSVDEFAGALGQAASIVVPVIEGSLADAPRDGYLVLFDAGDLAEDPSVASRTILLNVDRAAVLTRLERDCLVGAVEKHRFFRWETDRAHDRGIGLFGRKEVAARMGATLATPFQTAHFGLIVDSPHKDLPSLIAGYLTIYDELRQDGLV